MGVRGVWVHEGCVEYEGMRKGDSECTSLLSTAEEGTTP